ncbi:MAG: metallophosphoesterase family protein [Planctomycetota bacterium]
MSRIAVISDIHANLVALHAVMRNIQRRRIDAIVCLGDIVGYGPEPAECIALVRSHCSLSIRGNHEDALLDPSTLSGFNGAARMAIAYQRRVLGPTDLSFLQSLPPSFTIERRVHAVHDSPVPSERAGGYLRSTGDAARAFRGLDEPVCLVGHTHVPRFFSTNIAADGGAVEPSQVSLFAPDTGRDGFGDAFELVEGDRCIVNPGSVGQPRDGDPRASFAVLDLGRGLVEYHRVAYDIDEAARRSHAAGLPVHLAERLAVGA